MSTTSARTFDLLGTSRRRPASFDAPVWKPVERSLPPQRAAEARPAPLTPAMEAPSWPGAPAEPGAHPDGLVPEVPATLRGRSVTPEPAPREVVPVPSERRDGPAEAPFEEGEIAWFVLGTREVPWAEPPAERPPVPAWALLLTAVSGGIMFLVSAAAILAGIS